MENIKHCAILVRRQSDVWEGTRTTLGLAAHNFWAYLFVLDCSLKINEALKENIEFLEEMECPIISNVEKNSQWGFQLMPIEKIGRELKKMDLVIPFGDRS